MKHFYPLETFNPLGQLSFAGFGALLGRPLFGNFRRFKLSSCRKELKERLDETCPEICRMVEKRFLVTYTAEVMDGLLHRIGFVYKKMKQIPMKVDEVAP